MKQYLSVILCGLVVSVMSNSYCMGGIIENTPSAMELITRLEDTNSVLSADLIKKMLLQLGESGDKAVVPVLQKYRVESNSQRSDTIGGCAQVALAKLGDDNAFNEIVQETKTNNNIVYNDGFKKLGMVGNEKAVNILGQYLFIDKPPRPEKGRIGNTQQKATDFYSPYAPSYLAARALATIFRDKSPTGTKPYYSDIEKWREWWIANSNKYSNSAINKIGVTSQSTTNESTAVSR